MQVGAASHGAQQVALQSALQVGNQSAKAEQAENGEGESGGVQIEALGSDTEQGVGVKVDVKV